MKLSSLINELQLILDDHGDLECAFANMNDWRRHKSELNPFADGVIEVVKDEYGYVPKAVIESPRGYLPEYRAKLEQMPTQEVLLIRGLA